MENCRKHKDYIDGWDLKVLAEAIGDLKYDTLTDFLGYLGYLSEKLKNDFEKDSSNNRIKLARELYYASKRINEAKDNINKAWDISKPYMNTINISKDFSIFPFGQIAIDGKNNAERFREEYLLPIIKNSKVTVILDGTYYSSSWLKEAFGGLINKNNLSNTIVKNNLTLI
jgi:hypothetical protein